MMGMTWGARVRGLVVVVATLGALALASGADWIEFLSYFGTW